MKLAAEDAREFPWGLDEAAFRASRLHQNAVIRSLEVIGEAAGKVSSVTQQQTNPAIPWREIIGMRHRLIHGYAEIRLELVWAVATERLPALIEAFGKCLLMRVSSRRSAEKINAAIAAERRRVHSAPTCTSFGATGVRLICCPGPG
jgi:uncharacterized protein with HEPN domain